MWGCGMSAYGDVSCDLCGIRYYELDRHFCKDEDVALCVATLRTRAERAEQDARFAVEALLLHNKDALPMATRMVEMEQALSAAQSTIADLKAEVGRLRDFVGELADEPCSYGDGCPAFVGTRHGTCLHCQARAALGDAE